MDPNAVYQRLSHSRKLPTPPQILIRLSERCAQPASFRTEAHWLIAQDPALTFGLLTSPRDVPHSAAALGGQRVSTMLRGMDPDIIRSMIIQASVRQTFQPGFPGMTSKISAFWRHSAGCALMARELAKALDYEAPDEAYFAGLLHDMGKLLLQINFSGIYEDPTLLPPSYHPVYGRQFELAQFGLSHDEIAARMLRQAGVDSLLADAIHFHHDTLPRIQNASPLVRIVFCANRLCIVEQGHPDADLEPIARICPLPVRRIETLVRDSREQLERLARDLGLAQKAFPLIDLGDLDVAEISGEEDLSIEALSGGAAPVAVAENKFEYLAYEVRDFALLYGVLGGFLSAYDRPAILDAIRRSVHLLFNVQESLLFLYDPAKDCLNGPVRGVNGEMGGVSEFYVDCRDRRTLLCRTLHETLLQDSFGYLGFGPGTIVDEQINRLMGTQGAIYLPLAVDEEKIGVLVLGVMAAQFQQLSGRFKLLKRFAQHAALCLRTESLRARHTAQLQSERLATAEKIARNVVREVNNPLGVMRNHLHLLEEKSALEGSAREDLDIISEQIGRVAQVMDQLAAFGDTEPAPGPGGAVILSELIPALVNDFRRSRSLALGVELRLDLDRGLPPVPVDGDTLKAVLRHLLSNAVEALGERGDVVIRTRKVGPAGRRPIGERRRASGRIEITIQDSGPGIPESIRPRLFEPYTTTKGGAHLGMGLSIVQNLIRLLGGHIICETDSQSGTIFRIILAYP